MKEYARLLKQLLYKRDSEKLIVRQLAEDIFLETDHLAFIHGDLYNKAKKSRFFIQHSKITKTFKKQIRRQLKIKTTKFNISREIRLYSHKTIHN